MRHHLLIIFPILFICVVYAHVEVGIKQHHQHDARSEGHHKGHSHQRVARHNEHKINHKSRHNHRVLHSHNRVHHTGKARCDGPKCDHDYNSTQTGSKGNPYNFLYNSTLLAETSNSSVVGIIIDYVSGIVLYLDGKSENAVLVDPEKSTVATFSKGSPLSWAASRQSFADFFATVNPEALKNAEEDHENGNITNINNTPSSTQNLIGHVLANLGEEEAEDDPIRFTISLSKRLTKQKNVLKIIIDGDGNVVTTLNLKQLICVLEALAQVLANSEANGTQIPKLDVADILRANSGTEAFLNLLKQLGTHVDLTKVIGHGLTSIEIFFSFAVKFSAGSNKGIDGINKIIYTIIEFKMGHVHPGQIVQVIQQFITTGIVIDRAQIYGIYRSLSALIETQEKLYPNSTSHVVSDFFKAFEEGNLVYKSTNISSVIHSLIHLRPWNALRNIFDIFIQIGFGYPDTLLFEIRVILSLASRPPFNKIPGLDRHQIPTDGDSFQALLRNSNFTQAISSGCPFTEALKNVPILGTIIGIISQSSNATKSLNSFFDPSSPGLGKFLNIFHDWQHWNTEFQNIIKQVEHGIPASFPPGVPFSLPDFLGSHPGGQTTALPSGGSEEPGPITPPKGPLGPIIIPPPFSPLPLGPGPAVLPPHFFSLPPLGHGPVVFPPPFSPLPLGPGPVLPPGFSLPPLGPGPVVLPSSTTEATGTDDSEIQFSDIPVGDTSDSAGGILGRNIKVQAKHRKGENKKDTKARHH